MCLCYLFLLALSFDPVAHVLRGGLVFERGVLSLAVVEDFDVLEALRLHLTVPGKACAVNAFVLEAVEPAFGRGIVPAVAFATHRAGHAVGVESVLKGLAGILDATVGVMNNPWCGAAAKPGHGQGVSGQL